MSEEVEWTVGRCRKEHAPQRTPRRTFREAPRPTARLARIRVGRYSCAQLHRWVQAYWTNFAKTGDPNGAGLPDWPKFEGAAPATLLIDDTTRAVPDFRKDQTGVALRLWSQRTGLPLP